jgi:hypothetical protein
LALLPANANSPRTRKVSQPPLMPAKAMRTSTCADKALGARGWGGGCRLRAPAPHMRSSLWAHT